MLAVLGFGAVVVGCAMYFAQWHATMAHHRELLAALERQRKQVVELSAQVDFLKWEISSLVDGDDWLTILEHRP